MPNNLHSVALGAPYEDKRGNVTFIISSFGNQNTTKTADELIIQMLENRIKEREGRQ